MKSVVAFAFGAIAGIFGFQKHQELRGATKNHHVEKCDVKRNGRAKTPSGEERERKKRTKVIGVIPARYASTRFPEAFSYDCWETHDVRTYLQAKKATQLDALVAGDRRRTNSRRDRQGRGDVVMTDEDIPNGTERCAQAVDRTAGEYDIVVSHPRRQPLIEPEIIDEVAAGVKERAERLRVFDAGDAIETRRSDHAR